MKPKKYTRKEWLVKFIINPLRKSSNEWRESFLCLFCGYWYCFGCEDVHSLRTVKFRMKGKYSFNTSDIKCCSLHKDK